MKPRTLFLVLVAAALLLLAMQEPAYSHLAQYIRPAGGGTPVRSRWDFAAFPVRWNLNPRTNDNVRGARAVAEVIQASFNTWTGAPNLALGVSRGADNAATSVGFDPNSSANTNLICFVCQEDFGGTASGTLAITYITISDAAGQSDGHGGRTRAAGQIVDSDIAFNPQRTWNTGGADGQDMQTVATHEIGHFLGLDHSGVVRAMMFPFAPDVLHTLGWDDVAGMAALYPKSPADVPTGVISGSVKLTNGSGVLGAHVYADSVTGADPFSGRNVRKTPVGTLSLADGTYRIEGVPADSYIVIAEPLDEPVTDGDVDGFADAFGRAAVQTGFTTRWH